MGVVKNKQIYVFTKRIGCMNINDIITKSEYTKLRSAEDLFGFVTQKEKEFREWSEKHTGTKALREIKRKELDKGLPKKFLAELRPFAYYAKTYYSSKPRARFKPCCGSEPYDGIIVENNNEIFVEFTDAIDGATWGLQKELLVENGMSPWEYNIHGVEGNKTKRNRSACDIKTSAEWVAHTDVIAETKEQVKEKTNKKCKKSMEKSLPYGQNRTILIVTFDDMRFSEDDRDDFLNFKQAEIDSLEHNFIKISLYGDSGNEICS